ncbi:hypothetical protein [uncultured Helicobacter sp.]|uniref:hypothetical protein n=1 Tax=uncultured Helicobacter sp. TaxID=175537 RepID=UPI00374F5179
MKKFLNFIILSSVALLFNGCISGWGWLVPYSFQPSYHKFKKMCKLNELSLQERYTKSMEFLNNDTSKLHTYKFMNKTEGSFPRFKFSDRLTMDIYVTFKDDKPKEFVLDNVEEVYFSVKWKSYRAILERESVASYNFMWNKENIKVCGDVF